MSKKALLEEGSVRHFMKLANLKPLAEEFVTEMYKDKDDEEKMEEQEVNEEEETVTEGEGEEAVTEGEENLEESSCGDGEETNEEVVKEEAEEVTEAEEAVTEGEDETVAEEMEDDLGDMGEPEEAAGEMDKEDMLRDVVSAVAKVLDVDVNFGGEGEADAEMAMDAGEEAADLEMADELDDAPAMRQYDEEFDLEAVVAEVTKRVKERLLDTKE